jgi:hypothetical protein
MSEGGGRGEGWGGEEGRGQTEKIHQLLSCSVFPFLVCSRGTALVLASESELRLKRLGALGEELPLEGDDHSAQLSQKREGTVLLTCHSNRNKSARSVTVRKGEKNSL